MKWKLVPVEPDDSTLSAMHEKMYDVRGMKWHDGMAAVYRAGVNAAPPPQMLSDERIFDLLKQVDPHAVRLPLGFKQFAIAIEREILGGGE